MILRYSIHAEAYGTSDTEVGKMVYYIRFLKPPWYADQHDGLVDIKMVITITTDLGESFLTEGVDLRIQLFSKGYGKSQTIRWSPGMRAYNFTFPVSKAFVEERRQILVQHVPPQKPSPTSQLDILHHKKIPQIVSAWSAPLGGDSGLKAEKLVQRRFLLGGQSELQIWEETGESIACHIWYTQCYV